MGIQRLVVAMKAVVSRLNKPLADHLEEQGVDFVQISFRWFNCLLAREMPIECVIRLFDAYISELHDRVSEFPDFLTFFAASFLLSFADQLMEMDFQQMLFFLQKIPTSDWQEWNLELLLTQSHIAQEGFAGAHERAELLKALRTN